MSRGRRLGRKLVLDHGARRHQRPDPEGTVDVQGFGAGVRVHADVIVAARVGLRSRGWFLSS